MSLLDDDSEAIKAIEEKKGTGRLVSTAGLNRFKSLNRFGDLTQKYRQKEEATKPASESALVQKTPEPMKEAAPAIKAPLQTGIKEVQTLKHEATEAPKPSSTEPRLIKDQTEIKAVSKPVQASDQTGSKPVSSQAQSAIKAGSIQGSIQPQNPDHLLFNGVHIARLSGTEKQIIHFIFLMSRQIASRIVGPITRNDVALSVGTTSEYVKTAISRLCKKGYLIRRAGKDGKGGFQVLEIPESIYQQLLQSEANARDLNSQLPTNLGSKQGSSEGSKISSSSFNLNSLNTLKTTTTTELNPEWQMVQIPKSLKEKGLGVSVIYQASSRQLVDPKTLQESLEAYAFDVDTNQILEKKKIGNIQGYFMGCLMKGGYARPANFLSDEEKAERDMLERLEGQKRDRDQLKARIFELSFEEWKSNLSDAEKLQLKPDFIQNTQGPIFESSLKNHFLNNVFNGGVRDQDGLTREQIRAEIDRALGPA